MNLISNGYPVWEKIEQLQWAEKMKECFQEPDYHAEGDVYTHTKMVIEELVKIEEYQSLPESEKELVMLACLLHDIAKPKSTVVQDGKISSPGHSKLGEKLVRELLWDYDFQKREHICSLVRLHGLPVWSIEKENANRDVILSSLRLKNKLLYLVAKADMQGRISEFKDNLVLNVELFKEICLDNECFDSEKQFYNAHSKFKFYQSNDKYPPQIYDDTEFEITILSGMPGSGKDSFAKSLDLPMISLDDLRIKYKIKRGDKKQEGRMIQEAYETGREFCRKKQDFVWNSTNITYDMRSKIINTFKVYNPRFKIVYIETSIENFYDRREGEIDKAGIEKMFRMLEIPQKYEAHTVINLRN